MIDEIVAHKGAFSNSPLPMTAQRTIDLSHISDKLMKANAAKIAAGAAVGDVVLNQEETPCKREFMVLNSINKSGRNVQKQSKIYADDDDDRSLKYYKLGKSAQNIFKDHQLHF